MTISASGSSFSKVELGPSLSEVTTRVWPASSRNLRKPELARDAAEQLARLEVDLARRRRGHAAGIVVDLGDVVAGVGLGIAVDGIVIKNGENFCHLCTPSWTDMDAEIGTPLGRPAILPPHVAVEWDQAWRGPRCPPHPRVSSCRQTRWDRASRGTPTVGTSRQSSGGSSRRFVTADRSLLLTRLVVDKRASG